MRQSVLPVSLLARLTPQNMLNHRFIHSAPAKHDARRVFFFSVNQLIGTRAIDNAPNEYYAELYQSGYTQFILT